VNPSAYGLEIRAPANAGPEVYLPDAPAVGDVKGRGRVSPDDRERVASLASEQPGNGNLQAPFAVSPSGIPNPSPTSEAAARDVPRSGTSFRNNASTNAIPATGTAARNITWSACA
jgi:hypothetical protein